MGGNGSHGSFSRGGRIPSFIFMAMIAIIVVLVYNIWSLTSRNTLKIRSLELQNQRETARCGSMSKMHDDTRTSLSQAQGQLVSCRDKTTDLSSLVSDLRSQAQQLKIDKESATSKLDSISSSLTKAQADHDSCMRQFDDVKDAKSRLEQEVTTLKENCKGTLEKCAGLAQLQTLLTLLAQKYGSHGLQLAVDAGFDVTQYRDKVPQEQPRQPNQQLNQQPNQQLNQQPNQKPNQQPNIFQGGQFQNPLANQGQPGFQGNNLLNQNQPSNQGQPGNQGQLLNQGKSLNQGQPPNQGQPLTQSQPQLNAPGPLQDELSAGNAKKDDILTVKESKTAGGLTSMTDIERLAMVGIHHHKNTTATPSVIAKIPEIKKDGKSDAALEQDGNFADKGRLGDDDGDTAREVDAQLSNGGGVKHSTGSYLNKAAEHGDDLAKIKADLSRGNGDGDDQHDFFNNGAGHRSDPLHKDEFKKTGANGKSKHDGFAMDGFEDDDEASKKFVYENDGGGDHHNLRGDAADERKDENFVNHAADVGAVQREGADEKKDDLDRAAAVANNESKREMQRFVQGNGGKA